MRKTGANPGKKQRRKSLKRVAEAPQEWGFQGQ